MDTLPLYPGTYAPSLFEGSCRRCPGEDVCGGDVTSPCGCVKRGAERYRCGSCHVVCRERRQDENETYDAEFRLRLSEGLSLEQLTLDQSMGLGPLPILIPLRTRNLSARHGHRLAWAALNLEGMVSLSNDHTRVSLRTRIRGSRADFKRDLKLGPSAQVLAVLNGLDEVLEAVWPRDFRITLIERLRAIGVAAVTGPTFSVTQAEPSSHRIYMMMRHHKMAQEMSDSGMFVVPNLYWREDNIRDIDAWADWLRSNSHVQLVSRDFTRDKNHSTFRHHLDGLVRIVRGTGRHLHVIVLTGPVFGGLAVRMLADAGATCTVVSGSPIVAGMHGKRLAKGAYGMHEITDYTHSRGSGLAFDNVRRMEEHLASIAEASGVPSAPPLLSQTPLVNASTTL